MPPNAKRKSSGGQGASPALKSARIESFMRQDSKDSVVGESAASVKLLREFLFTTQVFPSSFKFHKAIFKKINQMPEVTKNFPLVSSAYVSSLSHEAEGEPRS